MLITIFVSRKKIKTCFVLDSVSGSAIGKSHYSWQCEKKNILFVSDGKYSIIFPTSENLKIIFGTVEDDFIYNTLDKASAWLRYL